MARQRATVVLPPPHQLRRLQEWLGARLALERDSPPEVDRKKRRKRSLQSIEGAARKLARLLEGETGACLLDQTYRGGSDFRVGQLEELALRAAGAQLALSSGREAEPHVEAAAMFLHLLHLNGSRWPSMSGNSELAEASAEVACFHALLQAADHDSTLEAARQLLTRQRACFERFLVPDAAWQWLTKGQLPARSPS
jgi:hypothetical protein